MRLSGLLAGIAALSCASGVAMAQPDVIVGDMPNLSSWGSLNVSGQIISAYSIATTSCNLGNANLSWVQGNNQHPVIPQNIYRLKTVSGSTRFEQLGASWLKHGFCALQGNVCNSGTPSLPSCSSVCGGCCTALGVGCSDPYSNTRNGDQTLLGPRQEVNPWAGTFPYPYTLAFGGTGNTVYKRCQVLRNDLDPAQNTGALYFGEACYVHPSEGSNANKNNNFSYKRILVGSLSGSGDTAVYLLNFTGGINRTKPAIYAWQESGLGAGVPDPNVVLRTIDDPAGGRFIVGYKVTQLSPTSWHYEFAVLNQNSDRGARTWTVPVPAGVNLTNVGFRDIPVHSGESKLGTDWAFTNGEWTTTSFASNPNSNALTWGVMYNFRFDADQPPVAATGVLKTFKVEADLNVSIVAPAAPPPPACPGDANGDGSVDSADLSVLLSNFGGNHLSGPSEGDFNGDGMCDSADLSVLLSVFGTSC